MWTRVCCLWPRGQPPFAKLHVFPGNKRTLFHSWTDKQVLRNCSGNFPRLVLLSPLFQKPSEGISLPVHGGRAPSMRAPAAGSWAGPANEHPSLTDWRGGAPSRPLARSLLLEACLRASAAGFGFTSVESGIRVPARATHLSEKGQDTGRKRVVWYRIATLELFLLSLLSYSCPAHLDPLNVDIVCSKSPKMKPLFSEEACPPPSRYLRNITPKKTTLP